MVGEEVCWRLSIYIMKETVRVVSGLLSAKSK